MDGIDGIELAREIRQLDKTAAIVFVTSYDNYAIQGYDVKALHYLMKPVDTQLLENLIKSVYKEKYLADVLTIKSGVHHIRVPIKEIVYLETAGRRVKVSLMDRVVNYSGKLSDILSELPEDLFVQCHQAFAINIGNIRELSRRCAIAVNGREIPVSRTFWNNTKAVFLRGMLIEQVVSGKMGWLKIFTYKSDMQMLATKNDLLFENYQSVESYIKKIALMKHEMLNHLLAIRILLDNGEFERLEQYLAAIKDSYLVAAEPIFCGHHLIQSILGHMNQQARQIGVETKIEVSTLPPMSITDADAVSLFMNLFNNALESCKKIQPPDRQWIKVAIKCRAPYLYISVKNALHHEIKPKNSILATAKKEAALHGNGIPIVRNIVKKYNGFATFEYTEDSFTAEAALRIVTG